MHLVIYLLILSGGYAIGRVSHIAGGQLGERGIHINTPHHWVYGALAIIVGAVFYKHEWTKWLIAFGIGHTISDLNDLLKRRIFFSGAEPEIKKFWGID
jgi:hypothetical protein